MARFRGGNTRYTVEGHFPGTWTAKVEPTSPVSYTVEGDLDSLTVVFETAPDPSFTFEVIPEPVPVLPADFDPATELEHLSALFVELRAKVDRIEASPAEWNLSWTWVVPDNRRLWAAGEDLYFGFPAMTELPDTFWGPLVTALAFDAYWLGSGTSQAAAMPYLGIVAEAADGGVTAAIPETTRALSLNGGSELSEITTNVLTATERADFTGRLEGIVLRSLDADYEARAGEVQVYTGTSGATVTQPFPQPLHSVHVAANGPLSFGTFTADAPDSTGVRVVHQLGDHGELAAYASLTRDLSALTPPAPPAIPKGKRARMKLIGNLAGSGKKKKIGVQARKGEHLLILISQKTGSGNDTMPTEQTEVSGGRVTVLAVGNSTKVVVNSDRAFSWGYMLVRVEDDAYIKIWPPRQCKSWTLQVFRSEDDPVIAEAVFDYDGTSTLEDTRGFTAIGMAVHDAVHTGISTTIGGWKSWTAGYRKHHAVAVGMGTTRGATGIEVAGDGYVGGLLLRFEAEGALAQPQETPPPADDAYDPPQPDPATQVETGEDPAVIEGNRSDDVPEYPEPRRAHVVRNANELRAALRAVEPGDHIVLEDGSYNGPIEVGALKGTPERPIVIRARNLLGATINYGLRFQDNGAQDVIVWGLRLVGVSWIRGTRITIRRCFIFTEYEPEDNAVAMYVYYGADCRFDYCHVKLENNSEFESRTGTGWSPPSSHIKYFGIEVRGFDRDPAKSTRNMVFHRCLFEGGMTGGSYYRPSNILLLIADRGHATLDPAWRGVVSAVTRLCRFDTWRDKGPSLYYKASNGLVDRCHVVSRAGKTYISLPRHGFDMRCLDSRFEGGVLSIKSGRHVYENTLFERASLYSGNYPWDAVDLPSTSYWQAAHGCRFRNCSGDVRVGTNPDWPYKATDNAFYGHSGAIDLVHEEGTQILPADPVHPAREPITIDPAEVGPNATWRGYEGDEPPAWAQKAAAPVEVIDPVPAPEDTRPDDAPTPQQAADLPAWPADWEPLTSEFDPKGVGYVPVPQNEIDPSPYMGGNRRWKAQTLYLFGGQPSCFTYSWEHFCAGADLDDLSGAWGIGYWTGKTFTKNTPWFPYKPNYYMRNNFFGDIIYGKPERLWPIARLPWVISSFHMLPTSENNERTDGNRRRFKNPDIWRKILRREFDGWSGAETPYRILGRKLARILQLAGGPGRNFVFDLAPECTGNWKIYSIGPDVEGWRDAWRFIVDEIREGMIAEGHDTCKFLWRPARAHAYGPDFADGLPVEKRRHRHWHIYPGDDWVDFIGLDLHIEDAVAERSFEDFENYFRGRTRIDREDVITFMDWAVANTRAYILHPEWSIPHEKDGSLPGLHNVDVLDWHDELLFRRYRGRFVSAMMYRWYTYIMAEPSWRQRWYDLWGT